MEDAVRQRTSWVTSQWVRAGAGHQEAIFSGHTQRKSVAIDLQGQDFVLWMVLRLGRIVVLLGFLADAYQVFDGLGIRATALEEITQV
jgi:hypothetical protein